MCCIGIHARMPDHHVTEAAHLRRRLEIINVGVVLLHLGLTLGTVAIRPVLTTLRMAAVKCGTSKTILRLYPCAARRFSGMV